MSEALDTVMIVDDSDVDLLLARRTIERSGLARNTLQFQYAEAALEHMAAPDALMPSLILLDINMPRMDGFEFLEALEARFGASFAPVVVMLTTSMNPDDETRAMSHPDVRGFRNKPLSEAMMSELCRLFAKAA